MAIASVAVERNLDDAEERFVQIFTEEKQKFDEVSLVNVNNMKIKSTKSGNADDLCDRYMVITILVAARVRELPTVKSCRDLKEALEKLHLFPPCQIQGALVMWAPQEKNDIVSEQELREKYPDLIPLIFHIFALIFT
ncbi:uncharacterized protein LOC8265884 [Ricinus communis]|uniref:uncharacterized protein LOC8265884 n=1 Tax=Ricinus communis TaxID=3988 RepID=UPI00077240B6|nr:uncharacterized protein LOC8265884 [Ricinus communis]|eukprot:XP_025012454.1 uncharacterized protein LOC8265884 [Ricinus communis]